MPDSIDASGFPAPESGRRQIGEFIGRFLFEPGLIHPVLVFVFFEHAFQRFEPLTLRQPTSPMRLEIPLSVSNKLSLCADRSIKAVKEILVVLPVRSTNPR